MKAVCASMQKSDSGLEVRDRMWLKITIPSAFIGNVYAGMFIVTLIYKMYP